MYQGCAMLVVYEGLMMKPSNECLSVGRIENVIKAVGLAHFSCAC